MLVADDEQRVSEPLEPSLERLRVELALDHEGRAIAVARELLVRRFDGRFPQGPSFRERVPGDDRCDSAEELDQPRRPGIDDARLAEDVQLILRLLDDLLPTLDEQLEQRCRGPRML